MRRPPLAVRGSEKKRKNRHDKRFEKQLRKEGKSKNDGGWKSRDDQEPGANTTLLNTREKIQKADHQTESKDHKVIDILV